jgi:hypothetical protein
MSLIAKNIQKREKANDKIYTPIKLVKTHLEFMKKFIKDNDILYEPFAGDGRIVNAMSEIFPKNIIRQTEIDVGTNFFDFNENIDCIISNPPYSILDNIFKKSIELKPRIISYLIGVMNLTPKRVRMMNENKYFIKHIYLCKVNGWFGNTIIITFGNDINENKIDFGLESFKTLETERIEKNKSICKIKLKKNVL